MNFEEYRIRAEALSDKFPYPGRGTPVGAIYCALKLAGEAGELLEKLSDKCGVTPVEDIYKETGDVLWNAVLLADELYISAQVDPPAKLDLSEVSDSGRASINALLIAALKVPEVLGKAMRDDRYGETEEVPKMGGMATYYVEMTQERKNQFADLLNNVLVEIQNVAFNFGADVPEICRINIEKLESRGARGTFGGSGDNR